MSGKSIAIIGGGLSGLSAGCYGQMNGYQTQIFEMNPHPGGLCTAWSRNGYTIGTPGWLMGSGPAKNDYYKMWRELGVLPGREIIDCDEYARFISADGKVFALYTDIDRLEHHMLELAPEDEGHIRSFAKALRAFASLKMPNEKPPELYGPIDKLKMMLTFMPHMGMMKEWGGLTVRQFAHKFQSPLLRSAWDHGASEVFFDADVSIMFVMGILAAMHNRAAGYVVGGSKGYITAIAERYASLGGTLTLKSRVEEIIVEDGRAVGVRLADGAERRADIVVSASDGHQAIHGMLGGKFTDDQIKGNYAMRPFPPILFASIGVSQTYPGLPPSMGGEVYLLPEPVTIAGVEKRAFPAHFYGFDPSLSPGGKTLVRVLTATDYDYWKDVSREPSDYKAAKDRALDQLVTLFEERYPGFGAAVEMRDLATPLTFAAGTGNWRGSFLGWLSTPETMMMQMDKTLPGLRDFYMIGTWVRSGSIPGAVTSGRHVVQIICRKDRKKFRAECPS